MRAAFVAVRLLWLTFAVVMLLRSHGLAQATMWAAIAAGNVLAAHWFARRWRVPGR